MTYLLVLTVLVTLALFNAQTTSFDQPNTTIDPYLGYTCPIECMCYQMNETTEVPSVWINCTVDYFSTHLKTLVWMVSSPLTSYAFFTCTSGVSSGSSPESSIWDGAFQPLGQLKALVFENCRFKRIPMNGFKGLSLLTHLTIRYADITDLDPGLLTYLPQLDVLEITFSSLSHLFPVCTAGHLRVLNISGNHFQTMENAGLRCSDGSVSQLESLEISANFLSEVPEWLGQSLPNLYQLGLADNYISRTIESPFQNLHKLTVLDFSNNSLTTVSSRFFNGCPNLLLLGMSRTPISVFPRSLLANLSVLQQIEIGEMGLDDGVWVELTELRQLLHLNVSGNSLTYINTDVMSQFLRLQYCYLNHNRIISFTKSTFEYQLKLNTLDLSFNEIAEIPSGAFRNQHVIQHLELQHNKITNIGSDAFQQLQELTTFDISHNRISSLPPKVFHGMSKAVHFDLSCNNISQINNDLFLSALHVSYLNLSHNFLSEMTFLSELLDLNTVDLSYNKIFILSPFLSDLRNLTTFIISHNEIKILPVKLFKGCENLKVIDLSYNYINFIDEATFISATHVQKINLAHNEITEINTAFSGLKDLEVLDLSGNKITKIMRGQFPHLIRHLNLARNSIAFISAHTFKSLNRIRTVDLSENMLTSLQRMDVEVAFNLEYTPIFKIQYNPLVCDCKLGWLKDWIAGKLKDMKTIPSFDLKYILNCKSPFNEKLENLKRFPRSQFLCPYKSHCEETCMCCDYACYCKYICPPSCQCYIGDDFLHVHHVQCNSANLSAIPAQLPEGATDLRLDGNNIQVLRRHGFLALKLVKNLYLNNSHINTIENNTFKGLKSVQRLFLNDNELSVIYSVTFQGLDSLEELFLNNNHISTIDIKSFLVSSNLYMVNLQNNFLSSISLNDVLSFINQTLFSNLKPKLFLSENHWSCDLDFACKFLSFVQKNSIYIADVSYIECIPSDTTDKPHFVRPGSSLLIDLQPELCMSNQTGFENMTRQSIEAPSSGTEIYALIAVCVIIVFSIALLVAAYANRHLLQVLCFTRFGFRVFKMAKPADDMERPYDAFISYSNKDEDFVIRQFAPRLENGDKKFRLCVHYRDFPVGASIAETIVRSVEASKRTILIISDNFLDSEWCRFEFQTAHQQVLNERRNRVILILLHDLDPDKLDSTLKVYMRTRTYLKYDDPWFWEKLMFALPDVRHRKTNSQMARRAPTSSDNLTIDSCVSRNPQYQATYNRGFGETIHNGMYEIPVLDPSNHYQLANSASTHTNSAYHNSDISESTSGYHNGSVSGSCCHYEEVGPATSSAQSTPQKQIGTPPPVPSIPKEGFLPRQKLMTLKV